MKLYNLAISFLILFPVCTYSQNQTLEIDSINDLLLGKWTWSYSYGGIAGITITPESEGYTKSLIFENDSLYKQSDSLLFYLFKNDTLIKVGKTKIRADSIQYPDTTIYIYRIYEDILNNQDVHIYVVDFLQDTLSLMEDCMDCFNHYYERDSTYTNVLILPEIELDIYIYPNPLSTSTTIEYELKEPSNISLIIYNHLGKPIETLVNKHQQKGEHKAVWNATDLPSGIYFYRLVVGEQSASGKLTIVK